MKIGIITLTPLTTNYGGILQAFALQQVLKRKGHEVVTIDFKWKFIKADNFFKTFLRLGKRWYMNNIETRIRTCKTRTFLRNITQECVYLDSIKECDCDIYVVGSDQVWRPVYWAKKDFAIIPFLGFTKGWNVRRVAYAASFGTDNWTLSEEQTNECAALAKLFYSISVRENSAVTLCKDYLGVDALHVLDPTMLLSKEEYVEIAKKSRKLDAGELMTYILDYTPEKISFVNDIAQENGYNVNNTNSLTDDITAPLYKRIQPAVEQWLHSFEESKMVITDSFHGTVFSIIFNKEFLVIGNKKRGMGRFSSLLTCFGLEDRLIDDITSFDFAKLTPIDWNVVNKQMAKLQKESNEFIDGFLT